MSLSKKSCAGTALENFLLLHHSHGLELSVWINDLNGKNRALEGNKSLACRALSQTNVPVPHSVLFSNHDQLRALMNRPCPFVVKFDTSIMLGTQTVVVVSPDNIDDVWRSAEFVQSCSGIVQDFVVGKEYTVTIMVGEHNWINLGSAVDYKKVNEHNQGPNTFGMGSIAPCAYMAHQTLDVVDAIVSTLKNKFRYRGLLSCQFLIEPTGQLWFLEYNTRFCDPEFQSILPSLDSDLITAFDQLRSNSYIDPVTNHKINAVTVGLIHQDWPQPQATRAMLTLDQNPFAVVTMQGPWDFNTYWGTVTHSGPTTHQNLANQIYQFLSTQTIAPYRYRIDIGQ